MAKPTSTTSKASTTSKPTTTSKPSTTSTTSKASTTSKKPSTSKKKKKPTTTPLTTVEQVDVLLNQVRGLRQRSPDLTQAEVIRLVKEERSLLKTRSEIIQRNELREDTIVRLHPHWHKLRDSILNALKRHPEALQAVITALEAEGAK